MNISMRIIQYQSKDYQLSLELRDRIMRKPLGLSILQDDLSSEAYAYMIGVFQNEQLLGMGVLSLEDNQIAKIRFVCVDTSLQKMGIGKMIVNALEDVASQKACHSIVMDARVSAEYFYKKLGYNSYGEVYLMSQAPVPHIKMSKSL